MRLERRDGTRERTVLTGMIVDVGVLSRLAPKWDKTDGGLFSASWSNLIASWCVEHYQKYGKAPARSVEAAFASWAESAADKDTVKLVEKYLEGLSGEYGRLKKQSNADYVVDLAAKHFTQVKVTRLKEALEGDLELGKLDEAVERVKKFDRVEVSGEDGIDLFTDEAEVRSTFTERREPLITFSGALGDFFGRSFERDGFIAFLGPEKRGKCVSEDQDVMLSDGRVRTIRQMVENRDHTPVLSLNEKTGKFQPRQVAQFWNNGVKVCYRLTTKSGRQVETTGNHRYLTPAGWKYLNEIEPGEFVAVPRRLAYFGQAEVSDALVKFLAYTVAEGCCVAHQPNFTNTDPEMVEDFHVSCDALRIPWRRKGITTYLRSPARQLLTGHGLIGKKSVHKEVPPVVWTLTRRQVSLFLRILFSCDGTIYQDRGRPKIQLRLGSEKLVRQVGYLLTRFGIVYSVAYGEVAKAGKVFPNWQVSIGDLENVNLFLKEVNFVSYKRTEPVDDFLLPRKSFLDRVPPAVIQKVWDQAKTTGILRKVFGHKTTAVREALRLGRPMMKRTFSTLTHPLIRKLASGDVLWDEVVEVRSVGAKKTYDLGVPHLHNFVAANCVVHNTFHLMNVAWQALKERRKVAFFEIGDLSKHQIKSRFLVRASKHPVWATKPDRPVKYPKSLEVEDGKALVEFEERHFKTGLDQEAAWKAVQKFMTGTVKSKESHFRLSVHPNNSLTAAGLRGIVQTWARAGWVADIVVIDYADLLAAPPGYSESRDQINANWKEMRRLSQEIHGLVVTATQANAASYRAESLDMSNFSEDKRKFAHVTGMVGINQTAVEKADQVQRLNWLVLREDEFLTTDHVFVAGCLALANPTVRSAK